MANKIYKIPSHIAIIMDGNGRWATKRGLPRNYGHREGVKAIERTIDACLKYGIRYCTFFAFSTENWKRSKEEIDGIFELLREYLRQNNDSFFEKGVKISYLGVIDPFPEDLKKALQDLETAIELDTKFVDAYYYAAVIKKKLQDYRGALKYLDKAIEIEPEAVHSRALKKLIQQKYLK